MSTTARPKSARALLTVILTSVVAVATVVAVPLVAHADTASLAGTVVGPTGKAVAGEVVSAYEFFNGATSGPAITTKTTSKGAFAFAPNSFTAGDQYTLYFPATATTYAQYLGNSASMTNAGGLYLHNDGANVSYVSIALSGSGTIGGKVAKIGGGALSKYTVRAYQGSEAAGWTLAASTVTSASGAYSLPSLAPADYELEACDCLNKNPLFEPSYSGRATSLGGATSIPVAAGKTASYSFSVGKSGSVSGVVSGEASGSTERLAGVTVTAYRLTGGTPGWSSASSFGAGSTTTAGDGAYTLSGLVPGTYTLEFSPRTTAPLPASGNIYGRQFLGGEDQVSLGDTFAITSGTSITGRNIVLTAAAPFEAQIQNSVDASHVGAGVRVTIDHAGATLDQPSNAADTAFTDASGDVTFTNLAVGDYSIVIGSTSAPAAGEDATLWQRTSYTFTRGAGEDGQAFAVTPRDPSEGQPLVAPTITATEGDAVGDELSADPGTWNTPDAATFTYQWLKANHPISGATDQNYTIRPSDFEQNISVLVTITDFAYGSVTTQTDPISVVSGTLTQITTATITGSGDVGSRLSIDPGVWNAPGTGFQYLWQFGSDATSWSSVDTSATHVVSPSDYQDGPDVRVEITGLANGYDSLTVDSSSLEMTQGSFTNTVAPKLTTTATNWSLSDGTWSPNYGSTAVTWNYYDANGTPHPVASSSLSRIGLGGKLVTVSALRESDGMQEYELPQVIVQKGTAPAVSGTASLSGTAEVDGILAAVIPGWTTTPDTIGYQWQYKSGATWKPIVGATLFDYTATGAEVGKILRVVVTAAKYGYATGTVTLTETHAIAASSFAGDLPVVTGTPGTGLQLTVDLGSATPTPAGVVYQWETSTDSGLSYTAIAHATGATYTIPASTPLGTHLYVKVAESAAGYTTAITQADAGVVTAGLLDLVTPPTVVTDAAGAGSAPEFTVTSPGTWSPTPNAYIYNWYVIQSDGSRGTPTSGSSPSISWDTVAAMAPGNDRLDVEVVAQAAGYSDTVSGDLIAQAGVLVSTIATPTLDGSADENAHVGELLTQQSVSWPADDSPSVTYTWQYLSGATWKAIPGSPASDSYSPVAADLGRTIRLQTVAAAAGYSPSTVDSETRVVGLGGIITPGSGIDAPAISGSNIVNGTITVSPGMWSVPGAKFTYQWGTDTSVSGATKASFVLPAHAADVGSYVVITATIAGYEPSSTTVYESTAAAAELHTVVSPKLSSHAGGYTVSAGKWSAPSTTVSYAWTVVFPNGSTGGLGIDSPTITAAQLATYTSDGLYVTIVASAPPAYRSLSSVLVAHTLSAIAPTAPLTITGTAVSGHALAVSIPGWSASAPHLDYQWYRGSTAIHAAISPSYSLTDLDVGKAISLHLSVSRLGFVTRKLVVVGPNTILSAVIPTAAHPPVVTGNFAVDEVLTAHGTIWNVAGLALAYQWNRNGTPIPYATAATYTPVALDADALITVTISASKVHYTTGTATSDPGSVAFGLAPTNTGIVLPATGHLDSPIIAKLGTWSFPSTVNYQWEIQDPAHDGWNPVSVFGVPYTPTAADGIGIGWQLRLRAFASRPGHTDGYADSNELTIN